jgi:hypothetical protein
VRAEALQPPMGAERAFMITPVRRGLFPLAICAALVLTPPLRAESPYTTTWTKQYGSTSGEYGFAVTTDPSGNAIIAGATHGNFGGTYGGDYDGAVAKYNSAGTRLWATQWGGTAEERFGSVASDAAGNLYLGGSSHASPSSAETRAELVKYNSSGALQWRRTLSAQRNVDDGGVAVDSAGNIYQCGATNDNLFTNLVFSYDPFLVKYDSAGNMLWSRQFGTSADDFATSMAVDGAGNVYVKGDTYGDMGGPNAGGSDIFLTKFDSSGNQLWSRQLGTSTTESSSGMCASPAGSLYFVGSSYGNLGGTNAGFGDAIVAKYDSAGNLLWTRELGSSVEDAAFGVCADAADNVFITGYTDGNLAATNKGGHDFFIAKYNALGTLLWDRQIGTTLDDTAWGLALDASGSLYCGGWTDGNLAGSLGGSDMFLLKLNSVPEPAALPVVLLALLAARRRNKRADSANLLYSPLATGEIDARHRTCQPKSMGAARAAAASEHDLCR